MTHAEAIARIQKLYANTGSRIPTADQITQSTVVTGTQTVNGNSLMTFLVNKGEKTALSYENLIDKTDAFAVTSFGMLICNEVVATPGKAPFVTYPNIIQFAASYTGLVAADLEQLYNGFLNIQVGQSVVLPNYPSHNFRVVRTTQQASATTFSEQLPVDGFATADPMIILDGSQKNIITLQRPAFGGEGVQLTSTATNVVKAVLFFQGYVISGGARN